MEHSGDTVASAKLYFSNFRSNKGPIDMLILQGGEALSSFRIQSLINRAQALGIHIEDLICTYLFFVMGDARDAV